LPELPQHVRFPILVAPRPAAVHEVASASEHGPRQRRNEDAVAVFALSLRQDDLSGTTTVAAVNGVATFNDLRVGRPGAGYTLRATTAGSPAPAAAPSA
jgi:hypothetical protein